MMNTESRTNRVDKRSQMYDWLVPRFRSCMRRGVVMVIDVNRIVERYDFNSVITGEGKLNPILYRFVLTGRYFKTPPDIMDSQMPDHDLADPSIQHDVEVLAVLTSRGKDVGKNRARLGEGRYERTNHEFL